MGKVIFEISTSLDGFTTAAGVRPEAPMGDLGEQLHAWAFGDDDGGNELLHESQNRSGASIAGRRTYDLWIASWGADVPGGPNRTPTFIVSHSRPDDVPEGGVYTFVESPAEAVRQARTAAGENDVDVFSASIGTNSCRPARSTRCTCTLPRSSSERAHRSSNLSPATYASNCQGLTRPAKQSTCAIA